MGCQLSWIRLAGPSKRCSLPGASRVGALSCSTGGNVAEGGLGVGATVEVELGLGRVTIAVGVIVDSGSGDRVATINGVAVACKVRAAVGVALGRRVEVGVTEGVSGDEPAATSIVGVLMGNPAVAGDVDPFGLKTVA